MSGTFNISIFKFIRFKSQLKFFFATSGYTLTISRICLVKQTKYIRRKEPVIFRENNNFADFLWGFQILGQKPCIELQCSLM